ncbi:hypothetical protein J2N86_00750 [Legionella lytica]|uniref:Uncharacterized protein n=1 Tax=Legionella lytica TaxID=96232 RepID=A0ABY4Y942_9GAMM|nr:hypothetical protein [Legionella lytica]USQ13913.1 hypothetical protein J2N86_00750 [Legionella lytica]
MSIFELLKKIFCCGSSTVPPEQQPILSGADFGNSIPKQDTYIYIGNAGINTTVAEGLQVDEDEHFSRTPPNNAVGTGSTTHSPGVSLGVHTPNSRSQHRRRSSSSAFFDGELPSSTAGTPPSPGVSLGICTPTHSPTKGGSTHPSPGFSLGVYTPEHSSTKSGSAHPSPGFSLGVYTPEHLSTKSGGTHLSPGFSLGVHTPVDSPTKSVGSNLDFSLGTSDDEDDTSTQQLVL